MTLGNDFVLVAVPDGGILLDLRSGGLFQLNRTATFIWDSALAGANREDTVTALTLAFGIATDVARADVTSTLNVSPVPAVLPENFRYELAGDVYRISAMNRELLEVRTDGSAVRKAGVCQLGDLGMFLRALSPKLIVLRGGSALHASAVLRPNGSVTAFLGAGGAGKTTTAHAFKQVGGCKLISEDKLIVRLELDRPCAVLEGESRLTRWIGRTRDRLHTLAARSWCGIEDIMEATEGPVAPITEILLVDRIRRRGVEMELEPLGPAEATSGIFRHGFYGSPKNHAIQRHLHDAVALATAARVFRASMPDGIEFLEAAASRYTEMTAS